MTDFPKTKLSFPLGMFLHGPKGKKSRGKTQNAEIFFDLPTRREERLVVVEILEKLFRNLRVERYEVFRGRRTKTWNDFMFPMIDLTMFCAFKTCLILNWLKFEFGIIIKANWIFHLWENGVEYCEFVFSLLGFRSNFPILKIDHFWFGREHYKM